MAATFKFTIRCSCALLWFIALSIFPIAAEGAVEIDSVGIVAYANDLQTGLGSSSDVFSSTTASPPVDLNVYHGNSRSENIVFFSTTGGQTALSVDIDLQQSNWAGNSFQSQAYTSARPGFGGAGIVFTVGDVDVPYTIAGELNFNATGVKAFGATLVHVATNQTLFSQEFYSQSPTPATGTWTFNGAGISGTLLAGETYYWDFLAQLISYREQTNYDPGNADGLISLTLGNANDPGPDPGVVPEAASLAMWSGLSVLAGFVTWRKRASSRAVQSAVTRRSVRAGRPGASLM